MTAYHRPLRTTGHCRHYSFDRRADQPNCALGIDLGAPGASRSCWPFPKLRNPPRQCPLRSEYTAEERVAWEDWISARLVRLGNAVAALPAPLPVGCVGHLDCPNCGGTLRWGRWHGGASVRCETPDCAEARFNVARGAEWPLTGKEADR